MDLSGKVVTVIGGTGFVGRYVVHEAAKAGATVEVVSRNPRAGGFLRTAGVVGQIVPAGYNPLDSASVRNAIARAHIVVSLAGILAESGKNTFDAIHHQLPRMIAEHAADIGVERLVHLSAIGARADSASGYARSKAAGEKAVLNAYPEATILRPSIIFGPEDQFFNRFASMAKIAPALPLIGGGQTRFQPVYVGDVADAVMAAIEKTAAKGQTYELGGPRIYTFKELMQHMLEVTGQKAGLVPIPWGIAELQGRIFERLPGKMITRDQVELLKSDNIVGPQAQRLQDLDIEPTAVEIITPTYLERFRSGGRFADMQKPRTKP